MQRNRRSTEEYESKKRLDRTAQQQSTLANKYNQYGRDFRRIGDGETSRAFEMAMADQRLDTLMQDLRKRKSRLWDSIISGANVLNHQIDQFRRIAATHK